MEWIIEQLNTTGAAFFEYALPMQIVSAILVGLALILEFALRHTVRASVRYWLVTCAFAYVVLNPLFSLCPPSNCLSTSSAAYADPTTHTAAEYTCAPLSRPTTGQSQTHAVGIGEPSLHVTWQGGLFAAWLIGVVIVGTVMIRRAIAARRWVAGSPCANILMKDVLAYCRRRLMVRDHVRLRVGPAGTAPTVCGVLRPVIVVPRDLAPTLGSRCLRAVLLHQLAHVKRRDLWVNMVQNIATVVYFYNPFVWMASAVIRRLRDQAADEAVEDLVGEEDRCYRQRLADAADLTRQAPLRLAPIGVA